MATMRKTCDFVTWLCVTGHERVKLGNKTPQSSDSATINLFIADFRVDVRPPQSQLVAECSQWKTKSLLGGRW